MSEIMGNSGFLSEITAEPGDTKLPLQTLLVRSPQESLYLNSTPYRCFIDEEGSQSLTAAVNCIRRERPSPGEFEPQLLDIGFGEPSAPLYDYTARTARVWLPKAVYQPEAAPDELAQQLETALSRDILQAIHQAGTLKTAVQERKHAAWPVPIGGASGALLAQTMYFFSDTEKAILDIIGAGTVGYLAGAAGTLGTILAKVQWQKHRHGSHAAAIATRAAGLATDTDPEPNLAAHFVKPPILLLPAPVPKPSLWDHRAY